MRSPRFIVALGVVAVLATACAPTTPSSSASPDQTAAASGDRCATAATPSAATGWGPPATPPSIFPVIATPGIVCGQARIVFGFLDSQNRPVGAPDRTVRIGFYDLAADPATPVATVDATFAWAIEGSRGIYVATADLPEAGLWGAEIKTAAPGAPSETIRMTFDVLAQSPTIQVGDKAPASKTPTLADVGGDPKQISTDATPDPAFYQTSVADALAAHKPFVLVFATPKFCTSQQCGPTLDKLKPIAAANPAVTFINVEPYQLHDVDGQLQPVLDAQNNLQATTTTQEWGLQTEPYIFAVDASGVVRAAFDLIATDAEMTAAVKAISPTG